ncbi:hypothetical protein Goari_002939 [Gossypium aridum]|uniref:RNase H type-1 domain-containing protein n=1 Tax=Gossypium aridum TaxID=34290 RepID=A0A7J8Y9X4_GOSAI|nr:hypothetical protein [Gossypium aridum]
MTIHALKDCSKAYEILSLGGLDGRLLDYKFERCIDWLKEVTQLMEKKAFEDFIRFCGMCGIVEIMLFFVARRKMQRPLRSLSGKSLLWIFFKIKVDAAIVDTSTRIRVTALDSDGFVLGRLAEYKESRIKVDWAEVEALREGINWACNNNVVRAIFETNCARLVNRIKKHHEDITIFGYRLKEIVGLLDFFTKTKINWINRTSNRVADSLSKLALNK